MKLGVLLGALGIVVGFAQRAATEPDLQSPEQRDLRNTAYSLPQGMWAFDLGALGLGGGEAGGKLGIGYGVGAGVSLETNLAHTSVGLLNFAARWHFVDTRTFDLGAAAGIWYGRGEWVWIINGPARKLVSKLDVLHVPLQVAASMPFTSWFQADLDVQYTHAEVFGTVIDRESFFVESQLGIRQLAVSPVARLFPSDRVELDLSSHLPVYAAIPIQTSSSAGNERENDSETVPFSELWSVEASVRSRFSEGLFGSIRLHYGNVARNLYGSPLYTSFEIEYRL